MYSRFEPVAKCGILPIVAFEKKEQAVPFVDALVKGGMPFLEVLFRTEAAADAIAEVAKTYPDFLIGAGTVRNIEQAQKAIDVGAKFIVLPGFDPEVVDFILAHGIPVVPGCITPGEIQQALKRGVTVQKFFPARSCGGTESLKELQGPYPEVTFVCTGGLEAEHCAPFLACPNVAAVGGVFMYKDSDLKAGNYDQIAADVKEALETCGRK